MKRELVTVNKKDESKRYNDFLTGQFSDSMVAIPIQRGVPDESSDLVTFELIERSTLEVQNKLKTWFFALRPLTLVLTLAPSLCALAYIGLGSLNYLLILAVIVVVLLQLSINLLNDYNDHMSGVDRYHLTRGSRAIQKGYLRAIDVKYVALALLSTAVLLGIILLLNFRFQQWFFALAGFFGLFIFKASKIQRPVVGLEEVTAFLITGPVLFHGLLSLAYISHSPESIALSFFLGMNSSIYFHVSKWQGIFEERRSGSSSLADSLGFDLSKNVAVGTILLSTAPIAIVTWLAKFQVLDLIAFSVVLVTNIKMAVACKRVTSVFSSSSKNIREVFLIHIWITLIYLVFWLSFRA